MQSLSLLNSKICTNVQVRLSVQTRFKSYLSSDLVFLLNWHIVDIVLNHRTNDYGSSHQKNHYANQIHSSFISNVMSRLKLKSRDCFVFYHSSNRSVYTFLRVYRLFSLFHVPTHPHFQSAYRLWQATTVYFAFFLFNGISQLVSVRPPIPLYGQPFYHTDRIPIIYHAPIVINIIRLPMPNAKFTRHYVLNANRTNQGRVVRVVIQIGNINTNKWQ